MPACSEGAKGVPGGLRRVSHPFGLASVGGGKGAAKGLLPCFLVPNREPAHGLHPCFVVAEIWADRAPRGGGGAAPQKHTTSQLQLDIKFFAGMPLRVFRTLQNWGLLVIWVASN